MVGAEEKPKFLEEGLIANLLSAFLNKVDNDGKLFSLRVKDNKLFGDLFKFDNVDETEYLWSCIESLAEKPYEVIRIKPDPGLKPYDPEYFNAKIEFILEKEALVRAWLDRPVIDPGVKEWNAAVDKYKNTFEDDGSFLLQKGPIVVIGKTGYQVVKAFSMLGAYLENRLSLRELSSRCFWGDSKYLDNKDLYVKKLFPIRSANIVFRPLMFNVYLPVSFESVLFVENQDTFLRLAKCEPEKTALIYSAGFKGAALRSRENGVSIFSYLNSNILSSEVNKFESFWCGEQNQYEVFFWGDLDLSGMAILSTLRKTFGNVSAWVPGYSGLVNLVSEGVCHNAELARKSEQKTLEKTGCKYADEVLLPLIINKNNFVDQEAYFPDGLKALGF